MPMNDLESVVGRFETVRLLGRGGMGEVYLARDPLIDRLVAVKVLSAAFDTAARERFTREARAAGRLHHENIVTIFDVGEYRGRRFIAMEYVPGETLATLIYQEPALDQTEMLRLIEDACVGLAFAHQAGVVHLDVKPENLIRRADGRLKVLDFGIARVIEGDETQTRHVLGTLRYMSPEQLTGRSIDRRSDVFGLGCVLYEVIARKPAFGGTVNDILSRVGAAEVVRLPELVPGVHPELVRMTGRAMALDPADRYDDLETLRHELAAFRRQVEAAANRHTTAVASSVVTAPDKRLGPEAKVGSLTWVVSGVLIAALGTGIWLWPREATNPVAAGANTPSAADPISIAARAPVSRTSLGGESREQTDFKTAMWQTIARRERQASLKLLRDRPDLAAGLLGELTDAARATAGEARVAADARGRSVRESQHYRSAIDRVEQAKRLGASGRPVDSLLALWDATDLFARATPPPSASGPELTPAPATTASPEAPESAAPGTGPAPSPSTEVRGEDARAPLTGTAPPPVESPPEGRPLSSPPERRPAEAGSGSPAPEDAVRAALHAYEAAHDQRDVAALRRIFPALSPEQAEAMARTFDGAVSYRVELRVLDLRISGSTASATCDVTHALVPKIGNASVNTMQSRFHLQREGGAWLIQRVERTSRR
jgi:predicted Ser/Thr protein kinase